MPPAPFVVRAPSGTNCPSSQSLMCARVLRCADPFGSPGARNVAEVCSRKWFPDTKRTDRSPRCIPAIDAVVRGRRAGRPVRGTLRSGTGEVVRAGICRFPRAGSPHAGMEGTLAGVRCRRLRPAEVRRAGPPLRGNDRRVKCAARTVAQQSMDSLRRCSLRDCDRRRHTARWSTA